MLRPLHLGWLALAALCASCNSGGGVVNPLDPLNPTPAPTGVVNVTPSPTPAPTGATPTPSPTSSGATPTPTPTGVATQTPTPTPTPTSGGTSCTASSAAASTQTYTFTGSQQTIQLPTYNVWSGSAVIPTNNGSGATLTVGDSQNNFDSAPTSTSSDAGYGSRTKDFFADVRLSTSVQFAGGGNPLIPITLNSPCLTNGTTYYLDLFALGTFQYSESAVASGNSVTLHIKVTVNPFPGNTTADVVVSH